MTQENPKQSVRNLERIAERKFKTYAEAKAAQANSATLKPGTKYDKSKVFARNDNTFDVVWYQKISAIVSKEQVAESMEKATAADVVVKVHGLKSKDRKKPFVPKKFA